MISEEEIKNFEQAVTYIDDADQLYKWRKYFQDVLDFNSEMKEKNQKFTSEYIDYIKPIFKPKPILISITSFLLMSISYICFNKYKPVAFLTFFRELIKTFSDFLDGFNFAKFNIETLLMFISSFAAVAFVISTIYSIYMIFKFFIRSLRIGKEKSKISKYLKDQEKVATKENAIRTLKEINETIQKINFLLNETLEQYDLDERIVNRENLPQLLKLMKLNKDNTITELQKYMFQNNMCNEHIDNNSWGEAMLLYDPNFVFYTKQNPWIEAEKKRRDKILSKFATVIAIPLIIPFGPLILLFMFAKDESKKKMKADDIRMRLNQFDPQRHSEELYAISGKNFDSVNHSTDPGYVDASGTWRNAGEGYVDASGVWRESGEGYVDASGVWRESGEGYVDASGVWREPGEGYVDASGVWRQ